MKKIMMGTKCFNKIYHVVELKVDDYKAICSNIILNDKQTTGFLYTGGDIIGYPFNINTICKECLKLKKPEIKQFIIYHKLGIKY